MPPQHFVGIDLDNGGAVTFLPPDGFAFFHIDNGPAGRAIGRLRVSYGANPGDNEVVSVLQNSNVGIGVVDPRVQLHALGRIASGLDFTSAGAITLFPPDGFAWFHIDNGPAGGRPIGRMRLSHGPNPGDNELMTLQQDGRVGVGTADPRVQFHVLGRIASGLDFTSAGAITFFPPDGFAWFHIDNGPERERPIGRLRISHGHNPGDNELMSVLQNGNVGIGTSTPRDRLEVNGNVVVTGDVQLTGADCAEDFPIISDGNPVEPGTVLVIDDEGALRPSDAEYDTRVAGVVAGGGGIRPGIVLGREKSGEGQIAVSLIGRVFCRVDAAAAAVKVGDLLTTSSTPGHAMKAADPSRAFGATLGKALRRLDRGRELLPILVALQ
jgi:hypothetical protein